MTKESYIFIRPPENPSSTTFSSPALFQLAIDLGEFKAHSGIEFDAIQFDRMHVRVTYWQDEAFIALRLKFGHWFAPNPAAAKPQRPILPTPPQRKPLPKTKYPDWWFNDDDTPVIWKRKPEDISRIVRDASERTRRSAAPTVFEKQKAAEEAQNKSMLDRILARYRK